MNLPGNRQVVASFPLGRINYIESQLPNKLKYADGVVADGKVSNDGSVTTASPNTITTATAFFTSSMIGKRVLVVSALDTSTYAVGGFISAVASSTSATFTGTVTTTLSLANVVVGSDNSAALDAAATQAALTGENIYLPDGVICTHNQWIIPDGIGSIIGHTPPVPQPIMTPSKGTCLVYIGLLGSAGQGFIELGTQTSSVEPTRTVTAIDSVAIDAGNRFETALIMKTRRSQLRNSVVQRGTISAVKVSGGVVRLINNTLGQQNINNVLNIAGAPDCKVYYNEIRQAGSGGTSSAVVYAASANNVVIVGNHFWNGASGTLSAASPNTQAQNIRIDSGADCQNYTIVGNVFDGAYGHHIKLRLTGGSAVMRGVSITGNTFFQTNGFPDATFAVLNIEIGAGTSVKGLTFTGNSGRALSSAATYRAMIEKEFSGTVTHDVVGDNSFLECALPFYNVSGGTWIPTQHANNVVAPGGSTNFSYGDNQGVSTQNGGGTVFNIAHSMGGTPTKFQVTPGSTDAANLYYVTADATNIIVTYKAATTAGVNNIVLNWEAKL